jgi:imidazolonepropionase-like amidohydrolase
MILSIQAVKAEDLLIRAGTLIDVDAGQVLRDQAVLVEGGRIVSVQPYRSGLADGRRELDWTTYTVAPGFMDMHTHLAGDIQNYNVEAYLKATPEQDVLAGAANARKTLRAGFTTVRDVGSYTGFVDVALRDAIAQGWLPGPRMFTAGAYVTIPGGGGEVSGLVDAARIPPRMREGVAKDEAEVRRKTSDVLDRGADWIKMIVTGAVLTDGTDVNQSEYSEAEVRTAVETAAARGHEGRTCENRSPIPAARRPPTPCTHETATPWPARPGTPGPDRRARPIARLAPRAAGPARRAGRRGALRRSRRAEGHCRPRCRG